MEGPHLNLDFKYPEYAVTVDAAAQHDKLDACGIDPAIYGEYVDITHFAGETIMAARRGGLSINGSVHVTQVFGQREPIRLGETLTLRGQVTSVVPDARGELATSRFELLRADGSRPLTLERVSLRADPARMGSRRARSQTPQQPEQVAYTTLARHQLEPARVARYSNEADNLIHSDPTVARQFGFKAPIAGGLMSVRYMMAALWHSGPVAQLQLSVRFRRPMFWDDALALVRPDDEPSHLQIRRAADDKITCDAKVALIQRVAEIT